VVERFLPGHGIQISECARLQKLLHLIENPKWAYLYPFTSIKMGTFLGGDRDGIGIMMKFKVK
jgi:hypothetical protein